MYVTCLFKFWQKFLNFSFPTFFDYKSNTFIGWNGNFYWISPRSNKRNVKPYSHSICKCTGPTKEKKSNTIPNQTFLTYATSSIKGVWRICSSRTFVLKKKTWSRPKLDEDTWFELILLQYYYIQRRNDTCPFLYSCPKHLARKGRIKIYGMFRSNWP